MSVPQPRPARVPPGGFIQLVAASSPFDPPSLEKGRLRLQSMGFNVSAAPSLVDVDRYLAAPDQQRCQALVDALESPDVDMVMAARGGYGLTRLLPLLDTHKERLRGVRPKLMCGFSDVTALHAFLNCQLGWPSIHGPVCTSLGVEPEDTAAHLARLMTGKGAGTVLAGKPLGHASTVEGKLLGGNLTVLMALAGTPWWPNLEGSVLLLEDVSERPYRLDRVFTQLMQVSCGLAGVKAVVLGSFQDCDDAQKGQTARDTWRSFFAGASIPVIEDVPVGHQAPNFAVPLGTTVRVDGKVGTLEFLEDAVA